MSGAAAGTRGAVAHRSLEQEPRSAAWLSITAALMLVAADAASAGAWLSAVHRFGPPPGASDAPTLEIDGDRRGLLFTVPLAPLAIDALAWDRETGTVRVEATLPNELASATRIQVLPHVHRKGRARAIDTVVVPVRRDASGAASLAFELADPALRTEGGTLRLAGRALHDGTSSVYTTEAVEIPPDATLRFAFGFMPPEAHRDPTRFTVSICRGSACERVFDEEISPGDAPPQWWDREAKLGGASGGGPAALRFEAVSLVETPRSLPVWSVPTLSAAEPAKQASANLLLISLDTLRADHLGTYGYARDTSPFIDRELAAKGTVFERSFSTATTTGPSHMSMFTGLAPTVHGVYGERFFRALPDGVPTLAEVLRQNGFATGAVTENGAMGAYRGFNRGFSSYYESRRRDVDVSVGRIESTLDRSLEWLARNRGARFFLFIHTYQVHSPYTPPDAYLKLFDGDGVDPGRTRLLPPAWHPVSYDREIRYTDDRLGDFFERATAAGLLEDTLVVLVSDHGDQFVEHGALGHGPDVYDEVLHVPLIVRGPGIAVGRRVAEAVSFVDLMATVLDWTGVGRRALPGRSFATWAQAGAPVPKTTAVPIFSEAREGMAKFFSKKRGVHGVRVETPVFAARLGDRKLIRSLGVSARARRSGDAAREPGPTYQYFDLAKDPAERRDGWSESNAAAIRLRSLLEEHITRSEREQSALGDAFRTETTEPGGLDPERIEKLRALGYLE